LPGGAYEKLGCQFGPYSSHALDFRGADVLDFHMKPSEVFLLAALWGLVILDGMLNAWRL
jgi:hypothetical protein